MPEWAWFIPFCMEINLAAGAENGEFECTYSGRLAAMCCGFAVEDGGVYLGGAVGSSTRDNATLNFGVVNMMKRLPEEHHLLPRAVPFPPASPVATDTFPCAVTRGAARSAKAKMLMYISAFDLKMIER